MEYTDSFGKVRVKKDRLWGPQTQRSLEHFDINRKTSLMPIEVVYGLAILKRAAAVVNKCFGLDVKKGIPFVNSADIIITVCE